MTEIEPDPTEVRHTYGLGDVAWCPEHFEEVKAFQCDPEFATLDLLERAGEQIGDCVLQPADAEVRVDFGNYDDPPNVEVLHAGTGETITVEPLCCVVERETLNAVVAMARHADTAATYYDNGGENCEST